MKMDRNVKPIKKCGKCPMNLGKRCWVCVSPRDEWSDGHECAAVNDEAVLRKFKEWRKNPTTTKPADLYRVFLRKKPADSIAGQSDGRW